MALMPEDVVKREFTKPKGFGRSGYDEIQVDDFLDEIVVELRRLNAENEDLTGKLEDCRRSKGLAGKESSSAKVDAASGVPALTPVKSDADKSADATEVVPAVAADGKKSRESSDDAALATAREELAAAQRDLAEAKGEREKVQREVAQAQERLDSLQKQIAEAEANVEQSAGRQADAVATGNDSAAGVIALAQRLHDEHVREGETTRDRLIAEAQDQHDSMVGEGTTKRDELVTTGQTKHDELMRQANERSTGLVKEAEERKGRILGQLSSEREAISSSIEQLKTFEHEYRTKLRGYIQGQLKDLEHQGSSAQGRTPGEKH